MATTQKKVFTRQTLYEVAWSAPMTVLGKQFCLPPLTLSGILRDMDIPLPPSGHWAKVAAGKPFEQPPLPDPERAAGRTFDVLVLEEGESLDDIPVPPARELLPYEVFERQPENRIVVQAELSEPHKLVRDAQQRLVKGRVDEFYGWAATRSGDSRPMLDICVSVENLDRALRIVDALLKALEKRGVPVKLGKHSGKGKTFAVVDGEEVEFGIYERLNRAKKTTKEWWERDTKWSPTGQLALRIYGGRSGVQNLTEDTKHGRLEERLNAFVVKLHRGAETKKQEREKSEERERRRAIESQREWERQIEREKERQRQQEEAEKLAKLEATVERWCRANDIRRFVAAVYEVNEPYGGIGPDSPDGRYLTWALAAAQALDPILPPQPHRDGSEGG